MSEKACTSSSPYPALAPGKLRIYSMRFCPYAQRTRLVLEHKNIDYETVNINLKDKPSWFLDRTPFGTVPVLQQDDKLIHESIVCSDYLDEVYPDNKLTPTDPYRKAQDRVAVELFSKVLTVFYKFYSPTEDTAELVNDLYKTLDKVEKILEDRGTPFFGGNSVQMVDLNIWPHVERFGAVQTLNPEIKVNSERFPNFVKWIETMKTVPAVKKTMFDTESHVAVMLSARTGVPNYDYGL